MVEEEENMSIGSDKRIDNELFVIAVIFFIFRPEEGYIQRLEFIKFLIDNVTKIQEIILIQMLCLINTILIKMDI